MFERTPYTDAEKIETLVQKLEEARRLKGFIMSRYGVDSFEDLPQEGSEWYRAKLKADGWEDTETSDE